MSPHIIDEQISIIQTDNFGYENLYAIYVFKRINWQKINIKKGMQFYMIFLMGCYTEGIRFSI